MKLHNLKKLYVETRDRNIKALPTVNMDTLAALTDYYFDTNYPGDNFVLVEKEEAERMYEFAKNFLNEVKPPDTTADLTPVNFMSGRKNQQPHRIKQ